MCRNVKIPALRYQHRTGKGGRGCGAVCPYIVSDDRGNVNELHQVQGRSSGKGTVLPRMRQETVPRKAQGVKEG